MRGAKPKPNALKILTKSKHARTDEPDLKGPLGDPPAGLCAGAVLEWKRVTPLLEEVGIGATADKEVLANYCRAVALVKMAESEVKKFGLVVQTERGFVKNPAITIQTQAMQLVRQYAVEFGLTPATRSKVTVSKPPDKKSRFKSRTAS